MNVLVLNLTRLGDLLQSQPAIADLKARGHRVGLVCLDNFAPAAELMQGLDAVFPLPAARLLARLDKDWRSALLVHRQLLDAVRASFPPDAVINLTPSEPARLLAMSFGAGQITGFALDDHGFNADTSLWAAFLQLAATSRGASPFNVVDIFRRIACPPLLPPGQALAQTPETLAAGGLLGPTDAEKEHARQRLLEQLPAPRRGYVALQLGASADQRRWPVARFAEVARGLCAVGCTPVLVGTPSERPLAERMTAAVGTCGVVDLVGGTNLRELAATLSACALLITNDTGTMHLAAGLGVPCLAIFLATAQPWDTGPYLSGCVCLEPDMPCHPCAFGAECPHGRACRKAIEPEGVLALALLMLDGASPRSVCAPGARVWRTLMGVDGLVDLESLSGHEHDDRTRFIRLQRRLYRPYLDGEPLESVGGPADMTAEASQFLARALDEVLSLLNLLLRQGELLARDPLPAMKTKFLATWQRVRASLEAQERLALLASLWTFEAERPGLDLAGILALAARFAILLERMRGCVVAGTNIA
ncbi:MAG: glycosyltransferase family 9 protein [Humidesulfovibrio sp.]|nr:glycosyltransferase family 9 protein [Humidesulfovibrio sp.]